SGLRFLAHNAGKDQSAGRDRLRSLAPGALAQSANAKGVWLDPDPSPFLRRRCLSAVGDPHFDPGFHLFYDPGDPASSELYPFRELAGRFEPRDVRRTVWDAEDRFEFLL